MAIASSQHPGPIPEIDCPAPPTTPCLRPNTPLVEFQDGEAARILSTANSENVAGLSGAVVSAHLLVTRFDPSSGFYQTYYRIDVTNPNELGSMRVGSSSDFRFGVPGLDKGPVDLDGDGSADETHLYQAMTAFCYDFDPDPPSTFSQKFCECWSTPASVSPGSSWLVLSPTPPPIPGLVQEAEDEFRRPQTLPKRDQAGNSVGGLGVSPLNLPWVDEFTAPPANGASIASDGDSVQLAQGMALLYGGLAKGWDQYAEVLLDMDPADPGIAGNYNFDLELRFVNSGSSVSAYAVKLVKGHLGRTSPTLIVTNTLGLAGVGNGSGQFPGAEIDIADAANCGAAPPLENGAGNPVWLRGEVQDISGEPTVTATIAWGCSLDSQGQPQPITSCLKHCSVSWTDSDDALQLTQKKGTWFMSAHEHTYRVQTFRAGSVPQP